jgi:hypothetical protein
MKTQYRLLEFRNVTFHGAGRRWSRLSNLSRVNGTLGEFRRIAWRAALWVSDTLECCWLHLSLWFSIYGDGKYMNFSARAPCRYMEEESKFPSQFFLLWLTTVWARKDFTFISLTFRYCV